ncbi:MAG: O-antigen ligase family protein [Propionibacteriaceae bacterium]
MTGYGDVLVIAAAAISLLVAGFLVGSRRDAVTYLIIFSGLLFLIPARIVLEGPLRSNGWPALVFAMGALVLWLIAWVTGEFPARRGNPVRWGVAALLILALVSATTAFLRPLGPLEEGGVLRFLVFLLAASGVVLLTAELTGSLVRLDSLVRAVIIFATVSSVIGLVQYALNGFDVDVFWKSLPGLRANSDLTSEFRSDLLRVQGTANHPIEFGVVAAMVAPLAAHYALDRGPSLGRTVMRACLAVLIITLPLAISRGAVLALVAGFAVLALSWGWRRRVNMVIIAIGLTVICRALFPSVIGTLTGLFRDIGNEPSSQGRIDDFAYVNGAIAERPWQGLGLGTFSPEVYFYVDNQYFLMLLEGGIGLLLGFVAVLLLGIGVAQRAAARLRGSPHQGLADAVVAGLVGFAVASATFDSLSFRQVGLLAFLLLGIGGALWRLSRPGDDWPDLRGLPTWSSSAGAAPAAAERDSAPS